MQKFAVIGFPILHSLSPLIHNTIYSLENIDAKYVQIISDNSTNAISILKELYFAGANVTAPFKSEIGINSNMRVINTLSILDNNSYNTDILALQDIIRAYKVDQVTILGGGNTSYSAAIAARNLNKEIVVISRNPDHIPEYLKIDNVDYIFYDDYKKPKTPVLYISTLPTEHRIDLNKLGITSKDFIIDALYFNNQLSAFAEHHSIPYTDGKEFLIKQAFYAHNIWHNCAYNQLDAIKSRLAQPYTHKSIKIALIGFMGVGKTTIAKSIASSINIAHYDIDQIIETKENRRIKSIFDTDGEKYFRDLESNVLKDISNRESAIVSCGGGIIESEINLEYLKTFDHVIWIYKHPDSYKNTIFDNNRPLWDENFDKLYNSRIDKYFEACTSILDNSQDLNSTIEILTYELKRYYDK